MPARLRRLLALLINISCPLSCVTEAVEREGMHSRPQRWFPICAAAQGELPCRDRAASTRTCEEMSGAGSFDTACVIASSASPSGDVCVHGSRSVEIRAGVKIACQVPGYYLVFNVSGSIAVGEHVDLVAGSVGLHAANVSLGRGLAGAPPPQTSGTPHSLEGAGGGHGGRGASCKVSNDTNWGGDVYAWAFLDNPWSYGSKGGSLSADEKLGGNGGGRVLLRATELLSVDGVVLAEGGVGNLRGGGGSGGSIMIKAFKLLVAADPREESFHQTAFKKEVIPKLWFEWSEQHCTSDDFRLNKVDIDDCEDELLDNKAMRQDIKVLYKR